VFDLTPDDDDPYFKKVGGAVLFDDGFFKILFLSAFFLSWFIESLIRKPAQFSHKKKMPLVSFLRTYSLRCLAVIFLLVILAFESSFDWPGFALTNLPDLSGS
jgi:hypothetical protein